MSTERQKISNRANAQKSTGPKSPEGRARSALNARSHGLNTRLDWKEVQNWYRVILEDDTSHPDVATPQELKTASLRLAEAEAHLERCITAERAHADMKFDRRMDDIDFWRTSPKDRLARDPPDVEALAIWLANVDAKVDPFFFGAGKILMRTSEARPAALHRKMKLLKRYRREAESRRRKAFAEWMEGWQGDQNSETNPNARLG